LQNNSNHIIKIIVLLSVFVGGIHFCFSQEKKCVIGINRSKISFSITHLKFLTVNGAFNNFSGDLTYDINGNLKDIQSTIQVESIDTKDKMRDKTLKSDAYLNTNQFPKIHFYSTDINVITNTIKGVLKIKNVKKRISMSFKISSESLISISTILKRSDFKLDFGSMNSLIGDNIKVKIEVSCSMK